MYILEVSGGMSQMRRTNLGSHGQRRRNAPWEAHAAAAPWEAPADATEEMAEMAELPWEEQAHAEETAEEAPLGSAAVAWASCAHTEEAAEDAAICAHDEQSEVAMAEGTPLRAAAEAWAICAHDEQTEVATATSWAGDYDGGEWPSGGEQQPPFDGAAWAEDLTGLKLAVTLP